MPLNNCSNGTKFFFGLWNKQQIYGNFEGFARKNLGGCHIDIMTTVKEGTYVCCKFEMIKTNTLQGTNISTTKALLSPWISLKIDGWKTTFLLVGPVYWGYICLKTLPWLPSCDWDTPKRDLPFLWLIHQAGLEFGQPAQMNVLMIVSVSRAIFLGCL